MKPVLIALLFSVLLSCNQSSGTAGNIQKSQKYLRFEFSKHKSTTDVSDPNNWCIARFGDEALIGADPNNFYKRLFALGDVPIKIAVDLGHQAAFLMLNRSGDLVEIQTSENQPACLSNKANFQINPDGTSFHYNNKMDIQFDVYLQELPSGVQIALELPPNGGHGLDVVRCETCK
jgi:hypothetical protein